MGDVQKKRCGKCDNCLHIERTKTNVLKTVNPPHTTLASQVDRGQAVVDFWNRELAEFPCTSRNMTYVFVKEWPENTSIEWWNEGRRKLNVVIRLFNEWQKEHDFDPKMAKKVLAYIEEGKQTWAAIDGGGGWLEELLKMEKHVKSVLGEAAPE